MKNLIDKNKGLWTWTHLVHQLKIIDPWLLVEGAVGEAVHEVEVIEEAEVAGTDLVDMVEDTLDIKRLFKKSG